MFKHFRSVNKDVSEPERCWQVDSVTNGQSQASQSYLCTVYAKLTGCSHQISYTDKNMNQSHLTFCQKINVFGFIYLFPFFY